MEHILLSITISVLLFQIVQSANSTLNDSVSSNLSLSKYYEKSAEDLIYKHLSGTQFCESILLPTEHTLRKSLQASLFSARNDTYLDDKDRLDSCCLSLHKCHAYKNIELNDTNDGKILHCECVYSFRICLKKLNTSLSSDLAFIHSINATKCYAMDHPIIKCVKFEAYLGSSSQYLKFMSSTLNNTFFNRCRKHEFDESQPQKLQLFDLPLIDPGMSTITMEIESTMKPPLYERSGTIKENSLTTLISYIKAFAEIECDKIPVLERESKGLHQNLEIFKESIEFAMRLLDIYCKNKEEIESDMKEKELSTFNLFYGSISIQTLNVYNDQKSRQKH